MLCLHVHRQQIEKHEGPPYVHPVNRCLGQTKDNLALHASTAKAVQSLLRQPGIDPVKWPHRELFTLFCFLLLSGPTRDLCLRQRSGPKSAQDHRAETLFSPESLGKCSNLRYRPVGRALAEGVVRWESWLLIKSYPEYQEREFQGLFERHKGRYECL